MQLVGYAARTTDPAALRIADDGDVEWEELRPGDELAYALADRHCAGRVEDGRHVPCDAPSAPYCDLHSDRWPCARCTGGCDMPTDACHEEHVVYLAAFAPDAVKVGVTRSWRLDRRLREQGADRAAHLRTVADGRVAREIEAEIAVDVGDRVRVPTKIAGLHRRVAGDRWTALLDRYDHEATFDFDYGLDLADRPVQETIARGTVVGTKGRILVLENAGSTYAVDLRDLVGYDVAVGASDRALQSSLGAFE